MRAIWGLLLIVGATASAAEKHDPWLASNYVALCGNGRTEAMCQTYLAGYRAAIYDFRAQAQGVERYKESACSKDSSSAACKVNTVMVAMSMFEGCNEGASKLSSSAVHQMILSYINKDPGAMNKPFTDVYQLAVADAFPCN